LGGIAASRKTVYDHERIGARHAPIPKRNQRLFRERLILTSIVMNFITNLTIRIMLDSPFCSQGIARAYFPGFPFEALVLHLKLA